MKILEQNWKEEFESEFYNSEKNEDYGWLADMQNGGDKGDKIVDFIQSLITSIKQEERDRLRNIITSCHDEEFGTYDVESIGELILQDYCQSLTEENGKDQYGK